MIYVSLCSFTFLLYFVWTFRYFWGGKARFGPFLMVSGCLCNPCFAGAWGKHVIIGENCVLRPSYKKYKVGTWLANTRATWEDAGKVKHHGAVLINMEPWRKQLKSQHAPLCHPLYTGRAQASLNIVDTCWHEALIGCSNLLKEHMFGRPGEHCFFSNDHWWQCDCGCQERGLCCSHRPGDIALGFNQKHFRDVATHRGGISRSQWGCILIHRMNINSSVLLGGGFKYVLFSPLLGEMIQFD